MTWRFGRPENPSASGSPPRVAVAGVAVRPLALSAAATGRPVVSVDHFGDRDHRAVVENLSLLRDAGASRYSPHALVNLAREVEVDEVAYGSDLENHPGLVLRLARGRRLLGNPPVVLRAVRDPGRLATALRSEGLRAPGVRRGPLPAATEGPVPDSESPAGDAFGGGEGARPARAGPHPEAVGSVGSRAGGGCPHPSSGRWLRKPLRGGGGRGVRPWRGEPLGPDAYLQERIDGPPFSLLFVADGRSARLLGVAEMLVGRPAFGASGYLYCGALLRRDRGPPAGAPEQLRVVEEARRVATVLARRFGLRGLNGADAVWHRGRLWTVEVNPRFTASMELLEGLLPAPLFELHRQGCLGRIPAAGDAPGPSASSSAGVAPRGGRASAGERWRMADPPMQPADDDGATRVEGKAILRARCRCRCPALETLPAVRAADLPEVGEVVDAGRPVCTVFRSGRDRAACLRSLRVAAERVYASLEPLDRGTVGAEEPDGEVAPATLPGGAP